MHHIDLVVCWTVVNDFLGPSRACQKNSSMFADHVNLSSAQLSSPNDKGWVYCVDVVDGVLLLLELFLFELEDGVQPDLGLGVVLWDVGACNLGESIDNLCFFWREFCCRFHNLDKNFICYIHFLFFIGVGDLFFLLPK